MVTDLLPGTGAAAFALHAGATPGVVTQRRVLHLDKVPADKITELSETARRAAPEYSLRHWAGRTPGFGSLTFSVAAFHDATGEMAVLTQVESGQDPAATEVPTPPATRHPPCGRHYSVSASSARIASSASHFSASSYDQPFSSCMADRPEKPK
jgi:hypothetical protein